jgi:putative salt-induced outer membrane protein YdiY
VAPDAPMTFREAEKAAPKWTGSANLGAQLTDGNSDARNANAAAEAIYAREKDRITLGFLWIYTESKLDTDGNGTRDEWTLTDRKTAGRAKYDYFFSKATYAYAQLTADNDYLQDLRLRWTAGAGLGHQFVDEADLKFAGELGATHFDNDYYTTSAPDDAYVAARAALNTTWVPNATWTVTHTAEAYPSVEDQDDFYGRSDLKAAATLTDNMLATLQWIMDYDNTPPGANDRIDNRYLVTLGWKF